MYIDLVRRVLEQAVDTYATEHGETVSTVLSQIREQIDKTSTEYRKDEPQIKYHDALCRLGYLYRHATANATLFELVVRESGELRSVVRASVDGKLEICAVGGGPGTELLGLVKYLLQCRLGFPRKVVFTVLDLVPQWAETWQQLADASEDELRKTLKDEKHACLVIAPVLLPLDATDASAFKSYAYQFGRANIIVFNYLFSERKTKLPNLKKTLKHLHSVAASGCVFVVIDRLEKNPTFMNDVVALFSDLFGVTVRAHTFRGTLDGDEQTADMGTMLNNVLGNPRVRFFTDMYRDPTVFWLVVTKP
ncbi:MAG: hypothetical protein NTU53_19225 [Planctomycetota bacterium]|nr:hypothetical protein [Planctomycetota bacterium]